MMQWTGRQNSRKPDGQEGHEGHRLTQMKATETHLLPDPEKYSSDPCYYATGEKIKRQKIVLRFGIEVVEYAATVFRNRTTGSRVHADFPDGFYTDITYDSSVKALAFLLANEGNMSAGKIKTVLYEVSGGALNISEATINGLCREFSGKTEQERKAIRYDEILKDAEEEYKDDPPNDYYREGYNLYLRLVKYKESELKFLHDKKVPADNSLAERLARQYKRKQKQAIVLRSDESFSCICDSLSVIQTFRRQEENNFYDKVVEIFSRPKVKGQT